MDRSAIGARIASLPDSIILDLCAVADILLIVVTAVLAKLIYIEALLGQSRPDLPYVTASLIVGVLAYDQMRRRDVYGTTRLSSRFARVGKITTAMLTALVIAVVVGYMFKTTEFYSRGWALLWLGMAVAAVTAWHQIAAGYLRLLIRAGRMGRTVAVIGEPSCIEGVLMPLRADPAAHVALRFAIDPEVGADGLRDNPGLRRFADLAQRQGVDDVVIALPLSKYDTITALVESLSHLSSHVRLFDPDLSNRPKLLGTSHVSGMTLFDMQRKPLGPWAALLKSLFDRVGAALALIAVAPVLAIIAVLIRLDSAGPVLFLQRRSGLDHKVFTVFKFRTMSVAEDGQFVTQASRSDKRVTRIGRWLRRMSLDELPQLVNVVRGDMSLVGPRPHALAHNQQYSSMLERYANRHRVKPGLTGWAQINGFRGSTQDPEQMRKRVEHDLYYIDNWSFWLDLKILVMTPFRGLFNGNAY